MASRSVFSTDGGTALWISDGTPSGTTRLASFSNSQIGAIATLGIRIGSTKTGH